MTRAVRAPLAFLALMTIVFLALVFKDKLDTRMAKWDQEMAERQAEHELALRHLQRQIFDLRNAKPYHIVVMRDGNYARVAEVIDDRVTIVRQCTNAREKRFLTDVEFLQSVDRTVFASDAAYQEVYAKYMERQAICGR